MPKLIDYHMVVEKIVQPDGSVLLYPQFGDVAKHVVLQERLDLCRSGLFQLQELILVKIPFEAGTDPIHIDVKAELAKIAATMGANQ